MMMVMMMRQADVRVVMSEVPAPCVAPCVGVVSRFQIEKLDTSTRTHI